MMATESERCEHGLSIPLDQFNLATHNGLITIRNPATDQHRTFRIETVQVGKLRGSRTVAILEGPDNTSSFRPFAFATNDGRINVWKRYRGPEGKRSAYEVFASMLTDPAGWAARTGAEYLISGTCRRCNRVLTHPESIASGLGPVCEGRSR